MLLSLSSRVTLIGIVVVVALASLAAMMVDAAHQARDSLRWVNHSSQVITLAQSSLAELAEAESGSRGYILTRDARFNESFERDAAEAQTDIDRVRALTIDNPLQHTRAMEISRLVKMRIKLLADRVDLARKGDFAGATIAVANGQGREIMTAISIRTQGFLDEERVLQAARTKAVELRLSWTKGLAIAGTALLTLLLVVAFGLLIASIRRPMKALQQVMTDLGNGQHKARMNLAMGSREFSSLAHAYNAMADQLELALADQADSEERLQVANAELHQNGEALRQRGDVIELLGGMAHRMHAARTDEELAQIIRVFAPRVLPGIPGALFAHNNSRNLLVPIASWGDMEFEPDAFAPDQCWALRRGQSHYVTEPGSDIVCGHARPDDIYHCEPLLAGGEVIGDLCLGGRIGAESRFRLTLLAENIASALVNHRLQRSLREQTIRDPLTGLFNRRYMEEALTLEIARAQRSGAPLSLVMCDVDHFKRFNDEFGHDAGDAVLQAVAAAMRGLFRDGDVVCRFGGEEFTVIAPGTDAEVLLDRVEKVRQAISELHLRQNGQTLGSISMSFGLASWAPGMGSDGSVLISDADAALYQAKREGRNRAIVNKLAA